MAINSAKEIIEDIRQGKMVILMDDEDRENEGDLIIAADCVEAKDIKDRKSTRLNSSHITISYAVFCLKKKKK